MATSPCTDSVYQQAAVRQGVAAAHPEETKIAKSGDKCAEAQITFIPFAVEVFGGWGPFALKVIKKVGARISEKTGRSKSEEIRYLRQKLSLRLQRCNAAMIQARDL